MTHMQNENGPTGELKPIAEYGSAILEYCNTHNYESVKGVRWLCENLILSSQENIPERLGTGQFVYVTNKIWARVIISNDFKLTGKCNYYLTGVLGFGALAMPFAVSA